MTVGEFWSTLVPLMQECGCTQSTGYRSEAHNVRVGGRARSWHRAGLAADVCEFPTPELREKFLFRAEKLFPFTLDEGDHIHVQGAV